MANEHASHYAAQDHFYSDCGYCHECIKQNARDEMVKELTGRPLRWISLQELKEKWPEAPLETAEGRIGAEE